MSMSLPNSPNLQTSPPGFNGGTTDDSDTPAPYAINSNIMVGAFIVLFLVVCFIVMLHVYARWFLRRSSGSYGLRRGILSSARAAAPSVQHNTGLAKAAIAQLPTFVYTATSPVHNSETGKLDESVATAPAPECAVCLSEFQENEKGRMLPACNHIFHTECIDMWFFSHSTCPLCRTEVVPAVATSTETTSTDQPHQQQEAMEPSEGNSVGSNTGNYPCNVLFYGNQTQVDSSEEPSTSSSPVSPPLRATGARVLPQITIDIPPIEGNLLASASGCLSAKCTRDQEAGSSQTLKSPGIRASIKRMLSRQSSRQKSPRQEGNEES